MKLPQVKKFLLSWTEGVIDIGKVYLRKGDYEKEALNFLTKHYAFETQKVLFKPTFTRENIFRNHLDEPELCYRT